MKRMFLTGAMLTALALPTAVNAQTARVTEIKGPGGMVCNHTNACACRPTLRACVACNNTYSVAEQTNWCKINNPALR